jgi:hypothetical protein
MEEEDHPFVLFIFIISLKVLDGIFREPKMGNGTGENHSGACVYV